MSSSSGKHYKHGHNGSNHYKKTGLFGKILGVFSSLSKSHKYNYNNNQINQEPKFSSSIICTKCKGEIPAGSKFCLNCGEKVATVIFCSNCGKELPPNAKFCLECGKKAGE